MCFVHRLGRYKNGDGIHEDEAGNHRIEIGGSHRGVKQLTCFSDGLIDRSRVGSNRDVGRC